MRFLLIALLSLTTLPGPLAATAAQAPSPLAVTAVSIWAAPLVPGSDLDPSDPLTFDRTKSALHFISVSTGAPVLPEDFDAFYTSVVELLPADISTAIVQEVVISQYGLGTRAFSIVDEDLLYDVIVSYDGQYLYMLMAIGIETSSSAMPMLSGIAEKLFSPSRPDRSTATMRLFLEGFAPDRGESFESFLGRLPQRAEVPAEYQLLDEEVIVS